MHLYGAYFLGALEGERDKKKHRKSHKSSFVIDMNITLCSLDVNIRVVRNTASDKGQERR